MPIDLLRARYMSSVEEQYVLIALDDAHIGIVQMFSEPARFCLG